MILAFISLTTPVMLGGLALLALPIIAHALNRHAQRRVVFPTIRLLQQSVASQSRLFRLRRWILLAIRCLMVALIVAAFARPVWFDVTAAPPTSNATNGVVLLVDASASTMQSTGGVNMFHTLRSRANQTLDSLATGTDFANIIHASARPHALLPRMSRNLPALRDELGRLNPTFERADLPQSIALAGESLRDFEGRRRLVILSDLQQSNWVDVLQQSNMAKLLPGDAKVTVIVPSSGEIENISLSQPRYFPTQPLADQPLQLIVRASNYSNRPKQVQTVLKVDGQAAGDQTVTLAAGEQRDVAFDSIVVTVGEHLVEFSTADDALPVDDHAYLVFKTVNRLPVLVVSDDNPGDAGSAAYFLTRALAPHNDLHDRFDVRHLTTAQLTPLELAKAMAVFVGYVGELSPTAAGHLTQYVEQGGGLMVLCGEGAVVRNLQVLDASAGESGLLPWQPGPARNSGLLNEALRITGGKWQSRLLTDFDEQSQISMAQIRFHRTWTVGALRPDAQVLLTFSDGTPALGLRQIGLGQLLLANFSPSLETSDLAKYGSFVALVQSLAKQLRPAATTLKPTYVGESFRHSEPISAEAKVGSVTLRTPGQKEMPFTTSVDSGQLLLDISRTERPGFHEFYRGSDRLAATAINVDPREGDPRRIDHSQLISHFEKAGVASEGQRPAGWSPLLPTGGQPFWGSCMAAAMWLIALELFLVGLWRR